MSTKVKFYIVLSIFIAILGVLFALINPIAKLAFNSLSNDILKTNVSIEDINIDAFDKKATINNLTIGGINNSPNNIIAAKNVIIDLHNISDNIININRINLNGVLINIEEKDNAVNIYQWHKLLVNNTSNKTYKKIIIDEFSMFYTQIVIKSKYINKVVNINNIYIRNIGKDDDININNLFNKLLGIIIDNIEKSLDKEDIYIDKAIINQRLKQKIIKPKAIKNKLPKKMKGMEINF